MIIDALAMLLRAHPKQALWHLSSLCLSISETRRQVWLLCGIMFWLGYIVAIPFEADTLCTQEGPALDRGVVDWRFVEFSALFFCLANACLLDASDRTFRGCFPSLVSIIYERDIHNATALFFPVVFLSSKRLKPFSSIRRYCAEDMGVLLSL